MKIFFKFILVLVGVIVLYAGVMAAASEWGGEVALLVRPEPSGASKEIRVWIVDQGGYSWIEHGDGESFWVKQLTNQPEISVIRAGEEKKYTAISDANSHDLYHQLRRERYGVADQIVEIGSFGLADKETCTGVPVRLE